MEGEIPSLSGVERDARLSDVHATPSPESTRSASFDEPYRPDELTDWDATRRTLDRYQARVGIPTRLPDLSVDRFTSKRLASSDFAGIIKIWPKPNGAVVHPGILNDIRASLAGRDPDVFFEEGVLTVHLDVEAKSFSVTAEVEFFACDLALMLDGLPWVVVDRYRNFESEESTDS